MRSKQHKQSRPERQNSQQSHALAEMLAPDRLLSLSRRSPITAVAMPKVNKTLPKRRQSRNQGPVINPAKPLSVVSREIFAQAIAAGQKAHDAYKLAGYKGEPVSRYRLRASKDVDDRINWLLKKRIEDDSKARQRRERRVPILQDRVTRELERVAFGDIRSVIQWRRIPRFDDEGALIGYEDEAVLTPSGLMNADAAAMIKSVSATKHGVKVDTVGKLEALDKLAKICGMYQPDAPLAASVTNNSLTVNVGSDNALDAARRLAFALHKAALAGPMIEAQPVEEASPAPEAERSG